MQAVRAPLAALFFGGAFVLVLVLNDATVLTTEDIVEDEVWTAEVWERSFVAPFPTLPEHAVRTTSVL